MSRSNGSDKMRIVVTVKAGANHELWADLNRMPRADRSERMRLLATLGEKVLRSSTVFATAGVSQLPPADKAQKSEDGFGAAATMAGNGFDADDAWGGE